MYNVVLGNFKELCNIVFTKFLPDFENFYNNKISQTSWKVQEEIIEICADLVKQKIIDVIVKTEHFALIVNEARYNSIYFTYLYYQYHNKYFCCVSNRMCVHMVINCVVIDLYVLILQMP